MLWWGSLEVYEMTIEQKDTGKGILWTIRGGCAILFHFFAGFSSNFMYRLILLLQIG